MRYDFKTVVNAAVMLTVDMLARTVCSVQQCFGISVIFTAFIDFKLYAHK